MAKYFDFMRVWFSSTLWVYRKLPCDVSMLVHALGFVFDGIQLERFGRHATFSIVPFAVNEKKKNDWKLICFVVQAEN